MVDQKTILVEFNSKQFNFLFKDTRNVHNFPPKRKNAYVKFNVKELKFSTECSG